MQCVYLVFFGNKNATKLSRILLERENIKQYFLEKVVNDSLRRTQPDTIRQAPTSWLRCYNRIYCESGKVTPPKQFFLQSQPQIRSELNKNSRTESDSKQYCIEMHR